MTSFRDRLTVFSFILTVLVVWIHAVNAELALLTLSEAGETFSSLCFYIQKMLGTGLGQTAVPGFFSLSGYLFFRNAGENEGISFFTAKWKKRIHSLLLPFLIWNSIYYLIYIFTGRAEAGVSAAFSSIVLNRCNPVFWYLRELIILTLLTPIIYLFIKGGLPGLLVLAAGFLAAVFYDLFPFHIVNEDALFYYMTGAFLAMHFKGFIETSDKQRGSWKYIFRGCLTAFIIFECIYVLGAGHLRAVLTGAVGGRTAGYMMIFSLVSLIAESTESKKENSGLPVFMSFNFFVYAIHYLEIRFFRVIFAMAGIDKAVTESLGFIIMPALCIAAAVITGGLMKKYIPQTYSVLTGGRG